MHTEAPFREKCRCGKPYVTAVGGGKVCMNCDTIQIKESMGFERERTVEDIRYNMYWLSTMDKEYGPLPEGIDPDWINSSDNDEEDEEDDGYLY